MNTTRTFGVELECHLPVGKTHGNLAEAIRRHARVAVYCETYNHRTQAHWKVTTDRSLDSGYDRNAGAEVVSPILTGEAGIEEARRVTDAMKEFGCTISVKCGLHVHVGANDLSVDELRNLAISFVQAETAFDAIVPPSRRRDINQYIQSNRTAFGGSYDSEAINKAIDAYKQATTKEMLITAVSSVKAPSDSSYKPASRYRKLNMQSMNSYGTVEFRQHSGTVDADKVGNWIRVCVAFVDRAKDSKPRKRPSQKPHKPAKELAAMMKYLRANADLRRFYQQRLKSLSEQTLQRDARRAHTTGQSYLQPAE